MSILRSNRTNLGTITGSTGEVFSVELEMLRDYNRKQPMVTTSNYR